MFKIKTNETLLKRKATLEDLQAIDDLARSEHFNVGVTTLKLYYEYSPDTWDVMVNEAGEVVAYDTANRLPLDNIYFGYSLFVRPDYRGFALTPRFDTMHYAPYPNMGNASPDSLKRYKFDRFSDKLYGYIGMPGGKNAESIKPAGDGPRGFVVTMVTPDNFDSLAVYDRRILGFDRQQFISEWLIPVKYQCRSIAVVAVADGGLVCGYGSARHCPEVDFYLTTLYADNDDIAEWLFYYLYKNITPGELVFLIFPSKRRVVMKMVNALKFEWSSSQMRVFCKVKREVWDMNKVYAMNEYFPI